MISQLKSKIIKHRDLALKQMRSYQLRVREIDEAIKELDHGSDLKAQALIRTYGDPDMTWGKKRT